MLTLDVEEGTLGEFEIVLSVFSLIPLIILIITYINDKTKPIKEDILLIEKYIVILLFYLSFILVKALKFNGLISILSFYNVIFLFFISIYFAYTFSVSFENFFQLNNPFYLFTSVIDGKAQIALWETFILLQSPFCFLLSYLEVDRFILDGKSAPDFKSNTYLFPTDLSSIIYLGLLCIITTIVNLLSIVKASKNPCHEKSPQVKKAVLNFLLSLLMLGYLGCSTFLIFESSSQIKEYMTISFFGILFFEEITDMAKIRLSDFYCYNIGEKNIGALYKFCGFRKSYVQPMFRNEMKLDSMKKEAVMSFFQNNLRMSCISQNSLESCEFFLNVSLASIYLIFEQMGQDSSGPQAQKIENEKTGQSEPLVIPAPFESTVFKNYSEFIFRNEHFAENDKLRNLTDPRVCTFNKQKKNNDSNEELKELNVNVKFFYPNKCKSIISSKNIDLQEIIQSLISHVSQFPFLISKNSKEPKFRDFRSFTLKTNDKRVLISVYEDFLSDVRDNPKIEEYIGYIAKENTFLPNTFGIFKVKINSFAPFILMISRNNILEWMPKDQCNYWQLMRYSYLNEIECVSTSKDRSSIKVTDEEIFRGMKIYIRNYPLFTKILKEDIAFLARLRCGLFSLLVMYYEFDQEPKSIMTLEQSNRSQMPTFNFSNFRVSDVKNTSENEDCSGLSEFYGEFNLEKCKKDSNGFDSKFNNFNSMVFLSFENVFQIDSTSGIKYEDFMSQFLENFGALQIDE